MRVSVRGDKSPLGANGVCHAHDARRADDVCRARATSGSYTTSIGSTTSVAPTTPVVPEASDGPTTSVASVTSVAPAAFSSECPCIATLNEISFHGGIIGAALHGDTSPAGARDVSRASRVSRLCDASRAYSASCLRGEQLAAAPPTSSRWRRSRPQRQPHQRSRPVSDARRACEAYWAYAMNIRLL